MVGNKKAETKTHNLIKHLIAHFLDQMNHTNEVEADFGDYIADVFDYRTQIAYEIQSKKQSKEEKEKLHRALLHAEIKDLIFIYIKGSKTNNSFSSMIGSKMYKQLRYKITGEE